MNTEEFIEKAKKIHGGTYDYSKVDYKNNSTNIIIACKIHGDFLQRPSHHIGRKSGCSKCSGKYKTDTKYFIEKAKEKHGDIYDYSRVDYVGCKKYVIIVCKKHGEFQQTPDSHVSGSGCSKCGDESSKMMRRRRIEDFIEQSTKLHGDTYDYSKVDYINCKLPVIITCKIHGDFLQRPEVHYIGGGCSKCAGLYSPTTLEFIEKAKERHGDAYDYSKVEYMNSNANIIIICKTHGDFLQTPSHHVRRGDGCIKCGITYNPTTEEFIEKAKQIHGDIYDYSHVQYCNANTDVTILCKKHGAFQQKPHGHINKSAGCPACVYKTETKLYETLKPIFPSLISQFKQDWCKKIRHLPYDFCIPEHNIIIELDGAQHFRQVMNWSSPEEQLKNDKYKEKCANDNGYSVIRLLQEDVLNNIYDWFKEICDAVEQIQNGDEIANVYLCKHDEYELYRATTSFVADSVGNRMGE